MIQSLRYRKNKYFPENNNSKFGIGSLGNKKLVRDKILVGKREKVRHNKTKLEESRVRKGFDQGRRQGGARWGLDHTWKKFGRPFLEIQK